MTVSAIFWILLIICNAGIVALGFILARNRNKKAAPVKERLLKQVSK